MSAERPFAATRRIAEGRSQDGALVRRVLPEEVPVALVHNGSTLAVMMATPSDLEDFAWGFALTEGVAPVDELGTVEVVPHGSGIEARMWLPEARAEALHARRRATVGPVGCGLCGIDSLEQATRALPIVEGGIALTFDDLEMALDALRGWQPLHDETRAVHGAGFYRPGEGIVLAREDVGRHNALDKLIGAMARAGLDPASGAIVLTSRISLELVQKAAMAGAPIICAVSSPTATALETAKTAGITLASRAGGALAVYTQSHRLGGDPDVQ